MATNVDKKNIQIRKNMRKTANVKTDRKFEIKYLILVFTVWQFYSIKTQSQ